MTRLKFRIYEGKKAQKNLRLFLSIYKTLKYYFFIYFKNRKKIFELKLKEN